jgi:hypothetical protein
MATCSETPQTTTSAVTRRTVCCFSVSPVHIRNHLTFHARLFVLGGLFIYRLASRHNAIVQLGMVNNPEEVPVFAREL